MYSNNLSDDEFRFEISTSNSNNRKNNEKTEEIETRSRRTEYDESIDDDHHFSRQLLVFVAPEDICEELKDGQWPDPSDCRSYFLCRGVGSQWGEQKREMCYAGKRL